jgi:SAM-dependent methyltransferase
MTCCCSFDDTAGRHFNDRIATRDLARYRTQGPDPTTRLLRDGLARAGQINGSLLDIGSGIGALTFELLDVGISRAVGIDAALAYVTAARQEADRRGRADATQFVHGDLLTVAAQLPSATVVTLDRVVCCYPAYQPLLAAAAQRAERFLALSYPRNLPHVRLAVAVENGARWVKRDRFRAFVHSAAGMDRLIRGAGFELSSRRGTWTWWADVYVRRGARTSLSARG